MTFAPKTLTDLMAYWKAQGGVNLGIVGDSAHLAKGVSYHLGKDDLLPGAYSARLPRDRAGLSLAASACDLGRLDGSLTELWAFSRWFAGECSKGNRLFSDVREVIFWSTVRNRVIGWSSEATGDGFVNDYGDLSHKTHTHISWFRDSEFRAKIKTFSAYPAFRSAPVPAPVPPGGDDMPAFKTFATPKLVAVPKGGRLFTSAALTPNNDPTSGDVIIDPGRDLPVSGVMADGTLIVGYRDTTPTETIVPTYYFKGTPKDYPTSAVPTPVPPTALSCEPFTAPLKAEAANAHHAGQQAEWDRQDAGATIKVELLPRP